MITDLLNFLHRRDYYGCLAFNLYMLSFKCEHLVSIGAGRNLSIQLECMYR